MLRCDGICPNYGCHHVMSPTSDSRSVIGPRYKERMAYPYIPTYHGHCHIIGSQRKLRSTHILLPLWACSRFYSMKRPSPHEIITAKLTSTLPVGVEPVLRSSACSPSLPRKLVRWVGRRCAACTHQWLIGGVRWMGGSNHDRMQTDCHKFINEHDDELVP